MYYVNKEEVREYRSMWRKIRKPIKQKSLICNTELFTFSYNANLKTNYRKQNSEEPASETPLHSIFDCIHKWFVENWHQRLCSAVCSNNTCKYSHLRYNDIDYLQMKFTKFSSSITCDIPKVSQFLKYRLKTFIHESILLMTSDQRYQRLKAVK